MTASYLRNLFVLLNLLVLQASSTGLNITGEAVTTRFWDCCKPSCAWKEKAPFSRPVLSCSIDDKPTDIDAGTGCNGGSAYLCSNQQPWAVNDTFSYGFSGVFILPGLTGGKIEDAWCCACYQLNFTSEPLIGKSMIVQASNTAYDINTANRFSLAVSKHVHSCFVSLIFGRCLVAIQPHMTPAPVNMVWTRLCSVKTISVSALKMIAKSCPKHCRKGANGALIGIRMPLFPGEYAEVGVKCCLTLRSVDFKRVPCPSELTSITQCTRNDEKQLISGATSPATAVSPSFSVMPLVVAAAVLLV